ncbi:choice-of-anchor J domain-containing protein [Flavobacterium sp. DGU11]|uniref:Choice-of-anchor J domain-containing protein n=1 Tax=Flavobacterium arundinis TaxID=3139143 RepID=A0ABU9HZB6_9FLAO
MKAKLLLVLSFISMAGYAQLQTEGFENNGNALPIGWQQINVSGPAWQWHPSMTGNPDQPPFEGDHAAYMSDENVASGTAEDWLVTPQFLVIENAHLKFYSRLQQDGDQQTTYRVMIHVGLSPIDISSYTELQQWTELEINPQQLVYNEIVVPIPAAYVGQMAYIAFVMNSDNGDGWLVDDVGVYGGVMNASNFTNEGIKLYPNPVKEQLNITMSGKDFLSVEVFDCNGRKCITSLNDGKIDMSLLSGGLYLVKVTTPEGTGSYKVFKE